MLLRFEKQKFGSIDIYSLFEVVDKEIVNGYVQVKSERIMVCANDTEEFTDKFRAFLDEMDKQNKLPKA